MFYYFQAVIRDVNGTSREHNDKGEPSFRPQCEKVIISVVPRERIGNIKLTDFSVGLQLICAVDEMRSGIKTVI